MMKESNIGMRNKFFLVAIFAIQVALSLYGQTTDTINKTPGPSRPEARAPVPDLLPGKGLAQHDFLYAGEWDTRKDTQTIFRIEHGKITWSWSIPIKDHNRVRALALTKNLLPCLKLVFFIWTFVRNFRTNKHLWLQRKKPDHLII
jgi:hypothetical protein